jgi:hypothetical protein
MSSVARLVRVALVSDSLGKDEIILRAYDCLQDEGIKPAGCELIEPVILLNPITLERALAALRAAGLEIKETLARG